MSDGRIFVAEITVVVDANGTEETFYFSTAPFTTSPSDTPANKPIQALLKNPGSMRYDLFSQGRLTGLVTPNYGVMSLANPYDANGKGVLDDWINYGVSNGKVTLRIGTPGDAYPSAWKTVYIARVYKIVVSEEVQITLRDRSQLLNKPVITDVFTGSGGEEGTGAGIGRKKAIVISGSFYIPPILINAQKQIYFVQANSEGGFRTARFTQLNTDFSEAFATYDNGIELTAEPDYSSFTEMESNSPSEGCVRFYFGTDSKYAGGWKNGPVYFRVGSPPAGELRVSVIGYPSDNDFEVEGFANGSWQDKYLLYRAGFTPDDIDLDSEGIGLTEQYVYEDETFLEVLSNSCLVRQGFFGFTKLDKFRAGYLRDPDDDDYYAGVPDGVFSSPRPVIPTTSLFSFTEESYRNLQNQPVPGQEIPVWAVTVNCFKTFPINEVAGGTIPLIRDYLTRQPYWITFKAYSDTTRIANPNAENVEIEVPSRDFPNDFTIKLFSYRYFHLYGGNPKTFTIETELRDDLLDLELHDVVTLQTARFGLSAGVKTRIIGMEIDCVSRIMRFTLWIPGRGQFTGNTSPLEPGSEAYNQNQQTKQLVNKIGKVQFPPFTLRTSATLSLNTGNESIKVQFPSFTLMTAATLTPPIPDPTWASKSLGSSGATNLSRKLFAYNGSRLVLGTYEVSGPNYARMYYSDDQGETWSVTTTLTNMNQGSLDYNGTAFVMHAAGNTCLRSTDGATWSTVSLPASDHLFLSAVGSVFIITADTSRPVRSTDNGLTFSTVTTYTTTSSNTSTWAVGTSTKMLTAGSTTTSGAVWVSTDNGVNWTRTTTGLPWGSSNPPLALAYSPTADRFVATNNSSNIFYSTDGTTWTTVGIGVNAKTVIFGNGLFVAFSDTSNDIAYSFDGISWTTRTNDLTGGAHSMISVSSSKLVAVDFGTSINSVSVGTY